MYTLLVLICYNTQAMLGIPTSLYITNQATESILLNEQILNRNVFYFNIMKA